MQRPGIQAMIAEPDPRGAGHVRRHVRGVAERAAGVLLAASLDAQRLLGMTLAARDITEKAQAAGCLAAGVTEENVRDALWAFNSPQMFGLLLRERGWSPDRFQAWLTRSWTRLLLDASELGPRG